MIAIKKATILFLQNVKKLLPLYYRHQVLLKSKFCLEIMIMSLSEYHYGEMYIYIIFKMYLNKVLRISWKKCGGRDTRLTGTHCTLIFPHLVIFTWHKQVGSENCVRNNKGSNEKWPYKSRSIVRHCANAPICKYG